MAELLLDRGADPIARDKDNDTPLRLASGYGHREVVALLLDRQCDVNLTGFKSNTPLSWYVIDWLIGRFVR